MPNEQKRPLGDNYNCPHCGAVFYDAYSWAAHVCEQDYADWLASVRRRIASDREAGPAPIPEMQERPRFGPLTTDAVDELFCAFAAAKTLDDLL